MLQDNQISTPADPASVGRKPTIGSNQIGMKEFNERVVLQAIRIHGSLSKADLARLTNLSTQTVSVIINRLLDEQLVVKGDSLRGKVGQPSQPIALHPDGAFSVGIHIGRRNLNVVLFDFTGQMRLRSTTAYAIRKVDMVFAEIAVQLQKIHDFLGPERAARLTGIGLTAPLMYGGWHGLLGMSPQDANAWTRTDMRERLQSLTTLPVEFAKDTTAACVAELVAGRGKSINAYLYIFVDTLIGGGLVINNQPYSGLYRNAGAIGSMALGVSAPGQPAQLLSVASLIKLEDMFADAKLDPAACGDERALQAPWSTLTDAWMECAADAIALSINNAACLLDLEGVIVDGAIHRDLLDRLLSKVRNYLGRYNWQGIVRPNVHAGMVGADAIVTGAAHLPLHAHFAPAHDLFLKQS